MQDCIAQGTPREDYDGVLFPHSYIEMWIECRRHADPTTGVPALPEPHKGVLDQDAELMLAFELLEEAMGVREQEEMARQRNKDAARSMHFGLHGQRDEFIYTPRQFLVFFR